MKREDTEVTGKGAKSANDTSTDTRRQRTGDQSKMAERLPKNDSSFASGLKSPRESAARTEQQFSSS